MTVSLYTGLAGPTIIYNKGTMTDMPTVSLSTTQAPSFYTLNGWVLANSPPFKMYTDDKVI
jgi:hypothetical protein